jgi:hypothetical protein
MTTYKHDHIQASKRQPTRKRATKTYEQARHNHHASAQAPRKRVSTTQAAGNTQAGCDIRHPALLQTQTQRNRKRKTRTFEQKLRITAQCCDPKTSTHQKIKVMTFAAPKKKTLQSLPQKSQEKRKQRTLYNHRRKTKRKRKRKEKEKEKEKKRKEKRGPLDDTVISVYPLVRTWQSVYTHTHTHTHKHTNAQILGRERER